MWGSDCGFLCLDTIWIVTRCLMNKVELNKINSDLHFCSCLLLFPPDCLLAVVLGGWGGGGDRDQVFWVQPKHSDQMMFMRTRRLGARSGFSRLRLCHLTLLGSAGFCSCCFRPPEIRLSFVNSPWAQKQHLHYFHSSVKEVTVHGCVTSSVNKSYRVESCRLSQNQPEHIPKGTHTSTTMVKPSFSKKTVLNS